MKVERANSVCSDDAPSSPDSLMSTGEASPLASPQPSPAPLTDPYDDQRLYSPAYSAHSPAYSISSTTSNSSTGSAGGVSPAYVSCPESPSYQRPPSPHFGFQFPPPDSGYPGVEQFGCQAEFVQAVREGNPRELKRILTRYSQLVQINGFTSDGQTALTQSCMDGNLEVIKVLVAHGASLHLTNRDGFSPLHLACWRGKYDVMQYLLRSASTFECSVSTGSVWR
ncbi:hypothetical protein SK128_026913 [Halocaridina rubra]|uniref:Notch-regulated ankyrin repeat-containing protein n=1 Tax=Halocaridina rubra TaxID=373956 RepID=A0AAN8WT35_HALRR